MIAALLAITVAGCGDGGSRTVSGTEDNAEACQDGVDNDGDGHTDCDDLYCQAFDVCDDSDTGGEDTDDSHGPGALLTGVTLTRIEFCQTNCSVVMENGEELPTVTPVFEGKPALVRVHVRMLPGWDLRTSWSIFEYGADGMEDQSFVDKGVIDESSTMDDIDSTLNYRIPAQYVTDGFGFSFELREDGSHTGEDGDGVDPIWPAQGRAAITIEQAPTPVDIVIVPIRYNADDSGRLPDVSDEQLDIFRSLFVAAYPLTDVNLTVREPFDWEMSVWAGGMGWESLLMAITELRDSDDADYDAYYYGLFMPTESLGDYCGSGCILGMSHLVTEPESAWARASIGLGFTGGWAEETMLHEVGHAHGLGHAPCGTTVGVDESFPYSGGTIGVPGYDMRSDKFITDGTYDFMSYCDPNWVSDYNFNKLLDRIEILNAQSSKGPERSDRLWRSVVIGLDGALFAGPVLHAGEAPGGTPVEVEVIDTLGVSSPATGFFLPFGDGDGGTVLFSDPGGEAASVRLPWYSQQELHLTQIN